MATEPKAEEASTPQKYELMLILRGDIRDKETEDELATVKKLLKELGKLTKDEHIGKRELAYTIKEQGYGDYALFQFESEAQDKLDEFVESLRLNQNVLRHLLMKLPRAFEQAAFDLTFGEYYEFPEGMQKPKRRGAPTARPKKTEEPKKAEEAEEPAAEEAAAAEEPKKAEPKEEVAEAPVEEKAEEPKKAEPKEEVAEAPVEEKAEAPAAEEAAPAVEEKPAPKKTAAKKEPAAKPAAKKTAAKKEESVDLDKKLQELISDADLNL